MLTISEELFLLTLDDTSGLPHGSISHNVPYALSGAILADLVLGGWLSLDGKKRVHVLPVDPPGVEPLAIPLTLVAAEAKSHKLEHWVNLLAARKHTRAVPASLVAKGFLLEERKHYLWVQPYVPYPDTGASPKVWIKRDLRDGVLARGQLAPRRLALLALVRASRMLSLVFTKDERAAASRQIDALITADAGDSAAAEVLPALESAVSSAVTAAILGS